MSAPGQTHPPAIGLRPGATPVVARWPGLSLPRPASTPLPSRVGRDRWERETGSHVPNDERPERGALTPRRDVSG